MKRVNIFGPLAIFLVVTMQAACKKLVSISDPTTQITTDQTFANNEIANSAVNGIYETLASTSQITNFMWYLAKYGGLSADEILVLGGIGGLEYQMNSNHVAVTPNSPSSIPTDDLWTLGYNVIYTANSVISGIAASTSADFKDSVRKQFTAEAKCLRAFCYFYLTNFYGDIPLLLSTDYQSTVLSPRAKQSDVYGQIIQDLKDAQTDLSVNYPTSDGTRTRINKWAATALLARAYLYTKDYNNAAAQATAVINNSGLYGLETDLNSVFLTGSHEAIWQLNQMTTSALRNMTPEGAFLPGGKTLNTGNVDYTISSQLLNAFDPGDMRRQQWIDSTTFGAVTLSTYSFSYKYKVGGYNTIAGGTPTEYSMVLRLAEQYLIRAEAEANGASGGTAAAIADLNVIRTRASLPNLPGSLSQTALLTAIEKEWQTEFFCECGLRWLNLKRTGRAHDVLSAIPLKQPWAGDYQLLYPIPISDIKADHNLTQNQGY